MVKNQKYEEAAKLRDSERKLIAELEKEKEKWIKSSKKKRDKVAEKNITEVYFDRGEHKYHGRVKVFAETLRKNGLKF